jgi:YNFM family putative membrane transporter
MAYYLGSTIAGPAGGVAWSHGGWSTVGALAALMLALALVLALRLRRTPPLAAAAVLAEA